MFRPDPVDAESYREQPARFDTIPVVLDIANRIKSPTIHKAPGICSERAGFKHTGVGLRTDIQRTNLQSRGSGTIPNVLH